MAQFNLELCSCVVVLAVFLPLASGACVDFDLGMGSGKIPNSDITASSEQSASTPAINGRLNYTSGSSRCARTSDTNPYLQIDLQAIYIICAVSTQGNSHTDQWVKNYTLQFSTNGINWTDYEESGKTKLLRGNDDMNSEKKHVVYGVLAKQLRFRPRTHQAGVCMRTEVFGEKKNPTCEMEAIGLASGGKIPDSSFSASSHFNNKYLPSYGRLNENKRGWAPRTTSDPADYLQIDLLYEYVICAVATQGANGINEWTENYKIQFSVDDTTMVTYQENNVDRVFLGNSNQNGILENSLQEFASAKFIGFKPTAYNDFKALRVEVYGILLTKVPSQPPAAFKLTSSSSTSITASWQLPPVFARHGRNITGFKLFYRKKGSVGSATTLTINSGSTLSRNVTGLDKYTEYKFQMLAFTSDGDGPKSAVEVERTKEDAPSQAPRSFSATAVTSTIITASWQLPPADSRNGVIIGFKLFYKKRGSAGLATTFTMNNGTVLSRDVAGLDIYTEYEFEVLAFTSVGDGPRSSPVVVVRTMKRDKPHLNDLPERTITTVGDLVVLTCDVSGDLEASVTWTKDGLTSIPSAQFKNSGKILIIQDVVLGDSGVYECKAMNLFGESRTSTVLIVAVPPGIMEELSPSEVICEKQTSCFLSCQASSYIPFNYSWTKDGQVPTSDNIKLMNNSIIVTPRDRQDYGEYVCHATNSLGSTEYTITLLSPKDNQDDEGIPRNIFLASVIALSCAVVVLLMIICGLIWQQRRAVPSERIQGKEKVDFHGVKSSPDRQSNDEQASDPNTYMELKARLPNHKQSHVPTEYQSPEEVPMKPEYYNMVLQKEIGGKQNEEVYEEI